MAVFPEVLPNPIVSSYGINPEDPVIRTEFEKGPKRARNRFTSAPTIIPVLWRFTRLQFEIFEAWHRHKINNGADWFTVNLLTASGFNEYEARFNKMWSSKPVGKSCIMWDVSAELEIPDRVFMNETILDTYL